MAARSRSAKRGKKRGLTPKQAVFVREYLVDLNASQAAHRAGYSPKTAEVIGWENLQKPLIAEAIAKAMEKRSERVEFTADDVLRELISIVNGEDTQALSKDRIRCLELLGKNLSMFKPVGGADNPLTIAQKVPDLSGLSGEQLDQYIELERIIADGSGE